MASHVSSLIERAVSLRDLATEDTELAAFARSKGWLSAEILRKTAEAAEKLADQADAKASAAGLDDALPDNSARRCRLGCRRPPGHDGPCDRLRL